MLHRFKGVHLEAPPVDSRGMPCDPYGPKDCTADSAASSASSIAQGKSANSLNDASQDLGALTSLGISEDPFPELSDHTPGAEDVSRT